MNFPDRTPAWRRYLRFVRRDVQADVNDELHFHFESRIAELVAAGATPEAARAQTAAEFGDVTAVRRDLHAIGNRISNRERRSEILDGWWQDIRYAARALRRTPTTTVAIVLTLTLGIGMGAVMFSLLDALYLRAPAGIERPNELRRVWVWHDYAIVGRQAGQPVSYPQYEAMAGAAREARLALYTVDDRARVGEGAAATEANVGRAMPAFFDVLGVRPALGRLFTASEDQPTAGAHVVLLSDAFWRAHFNADSGVLGTKIRIGQHPYTVVGVTKRGFSGVDLDAVDLWAPLATSDEGRTPEGKPRWQSASLFRFGAVLRLHPSANETVLNQQLTAAVLASNQLLSARDSLRVEVGPLLVTRGPGVLTKEQTIAIRLGAVAVIVLLIACANVVNLLLAGAVERRQEISVRLALGVSRGRLVRLVLAESVLLAFVAAIAATLCARWGGALLRRLLMPDIHWANGPLQASVLAFTFGVALLAGIFTGLLPAWQSASTDLAGALKSARRAAGVRRAWVRSALVVAQAALSVVLLVGAALFIRSLANVQNLNIGYDVDHVITLRPRFVNAQSLSRAEQGRRMRALTARLQSAPGVQHLALVDIVPMTGFSTVRFYTANDSLGSKPGFFPTVTRVSPGFFAAMGMRLSRGGDFSPGHGAATPHEVIVNETMANIVWPGVDPIGKCMHIDAHTSPCYHVVGVAQGGRMDEILEPPQPLFYLPLDVLPPEQDAAYNLVMLASGDGAAALGAARQVVRELFPGATMDVRRMSDHLEPQYRPWRLGARLFTACGLLALVVALVGIYSTMSYMVSQRRHELGVRLALGATRTNIVRLVVGGSTRVVLLGIVVGLLLAFAGGRFLAALLYDVKPNDPLSMGLVAAALTLVAVLAALGPAWRASRVDPVTSLRAD